MPVPRAGRSAVAPLYLLACLIIGGSAQGAWQNAVLQLVGVGIIAWGGIARSAGGEMAPRARTLLLLAIAAIAMVALQNVPLPPSLWAHGLRRRIAADYRLQGIGLPWLPISLTPYESLSSLLGLIPPLAMFVAIIRLNAYRQSWLAVALLAGTLAGVVLGALQVASAQPNSRWYPYAETNFGSAVGFFANANHMASLLLLTLPFLAAIASAVRGRNLQLYSALLMVLAALALVLIAGITLNGSLAGYALALPVLAASSLILVSSSSMWRKIALAIAALSATAAVIVLATTSIGVPAGRFGPTATTAIQSRQAILKTTGEALADSMPLGSGLGSFVRVYRLYESPDTATTEYVVHAHNDYAELALELGVPGVFLIVAFLAWWVSAAGAVWLPGKGGPFARAASIASVAVLIHSLVDFPLRTAAISSCFAMCLALLADRRRPTPREAAELRPARHVVIK